MGWGRAEVGARFPLRVALEQHVEHTMGWNLGHPKPHSWFPQMCRAKSFPRNHLVLAWSHLLLPRALSFSTPDRGRAVGS